MRTPRIDRMRERHFNTTPCITAEHLVLQTQAYKQFAGDAVPVFRAKVVNLPCSTNLTREDAQRVVDALLAL